MKVLAAALAGAVVAAMMITFCGAGQRAARAQQAHECPRPPPLT